MAEKWKASLWERKKGLVDLAGGDEELYLRKGTLTRDPGVVRVIAPSDTYLTFDIAKVEALGNFTPEDTGIKVAPGKVRTFSGYWAALGLTTNDRVLYNLAFHAEDPDPDQGGGRSPFSANMKDFMEKWGWVVGAIVALLILVLVIYLLVVLR